MLAAIRQEFARSSRILIVTHIRPDGDAVGSLLGLGLLLRRAGKEVVLLISGEVPESLRFLAGSDTIVSNTTGDFDLIVSVDVSEIHRLGGTLRENRMPDINIDHHFTNPLFGRINFVDPDASATAQMIADHLDDFGLTCTPEAAQALLTGILTDTLGFRVQSVTPQTLRSAAFLMEQGADLALNYKHALMQRSYQAARYWGAGLSELQIEGKIVSAALTLKARVATGYSGNDDADLVNILSGIREAPIAVMFVEQADSSHPAGPRVKVSWRAQDATDVSQIAALFGGGGHRAAAGAEIAGDLITVRRKILDATAAAMGGRQAYPPSVEEYNDV